MTAHKSILSIVVGIGVLASVPAKAEDWYIQGFAGYTFGDDASFSGLIGGAPNSVFTEFDDGYNIGVAVGRSFDLPDTGTRLRGEVELSFGENDADSFNFSGNGPGLEINPGGDVSSTNLFGNLLLDFDTGTRFTPYVGGGLGVSFVDQNLVYGPGVTITGSDEVFAGQLIVGGSYDINETTSIFGDVRYTRAFDVTGIRTSPGGVASVSDDLSTTALNIGLRFKF
jgi:opacity protein-like surface antigen